MEVRTRLRRCGVLFIVAAYLSFLPVMAASAQPVTDPAVAGEAGATNAETAPESPPVTPPEAGTGQKETVAISLNNVNVDQVMKFLSEVTGKFVVKHKDVQAQLTVYSPTEVSRDKAFALICDALLLEKVAVIESKDTLQLVPVDLVSEVAAEMLPGTTEEPSAGIVRKAIPVRFANVDEIEKLVKPLLSKTGVLLAHPGSKQIIVTDTANRVANIADIVAQMDVLDIDQRQVQVFELKHADAEVLAPIVKAVLTVLVAKTQGQQQAGKEQQPGQPPPQPGQKGAPGPGEGMLDVQPYKTANWLVIVAPKEILEAAKPLVEELDREQPPELTLRVLPLQFADAKEAAAQLMPLFKERPEKQIREIVEITAHERSNSLLVLSSQENFDLVRSVVAELDTEESVQMTTKTYELLHADAEDIAEQMNDLYSGLEQSSYRSYYSYYSPRRQEAQTRFVPERRTNSVIAIARPTELDKISELITKLDKPIDAEQVAPRIYHVRYVDAKDMTDVLNKIFGAEDTDQRGGYYDYWYGAYSEEKEGVGRLYGKVQFVPETTTNSIIVTTNNQENFRIIEDFIRELDMFSPEAANTIVVNLQNAKATDIADELNSLFAREGAQAPKKEGEEERSSYYAWLFGGQQKKEERPISNLIGQVRVVPDIRTNSLSITTAFQNFELLRDLIDKLDVESPKVLVRVRLIEITTTKASRIGTRFSADPSTFESDDFDNGLKSNFGFTWQEVHRDGTLNANIDIGLLVQFLQRNADSRILSEPTLVMNNNEAANIFVGSRIPFITASQSTPEGTLNQSFEYKDAGTTLKITPNINQLDKVVMKVELESSQIRPGEVLFGGFIIDTRKFETEVAVETNETIVIGGIMRESEAKAVRRVPVLGHIPVVNLAFRKKDTKRETTELIAFITPQVLRKTEEAQAATREAAEHVQIIREWRPLPGIPEDEGTAKSAQ